MAANGSSSHPLSNPHCVTSTLHTLRNFIQFTLKPLQLSVPRCLYFMDQETEELDMKRPAQEHPALKYFLGEPPPSWTPEAPLSPTAGLRPIKESIYSVYEVRKIIVVFFLVFFHPEKR